MRIAQCIEQNADLVEREFTAGLAGARVKLRHHCIQLIDGCGVGHGKFSIEGESPSLTDVTQLAARLKMLRKKSERKANLAKDGLAGAKALFILLTLSARLKPCPCYKAPRLSFPAACKAQLILLILLARLKPCPYYKAPWVSFSPTCEVVSFRNINDNLCGEHY